MENAVRIDKLGADELKIPIELYSSLEKYPKLLYALRKSLDGLILLELAEVKNHLKEHFNLDIKTAKEFLVHSNRETQQGREILYTYLYADLLNNLIQELDSNLKITRNIAIAIPEEDRGIDSYIRVVGADSLNALAIQICEIKSVGESTKSEMLECLYATIKKAKFKPVVEQSSLLCVISSDTPHQVNIETFREYFEQDNWEYEKILLMQIFKTGSVIFTVFRSNDDDGHYMLKNIDGEFEYQTDKESIYI